MSRISSWEFWIPGWRQAIVFVLLALMGLGLWAFSVYVAPYFNQSGSLSQPGSLFAEALNTGVVYYALLALVSGFVLPKGFYLWGIAIVLTHPFAVLIEAAYFQSQGVVEIVRGGVMGWVGYAVVLVMLTAATAVLTTMLSTAGVGLRLLLDLLRNRSSGPSQDARVR